MQNILNSGIQKKKLKQLIYLTIPVALQNVLGLVVNFVSTVMLGSMGEVAITASSLSNQYFFILSLIIYGIIGGSNVLVAQYWGKEDTISINKVLAYTYKLATFASIGFMVLGIAIPGKILGIFTNDPQVIIQGSSYLRISAISYLFYSLTTVTTGTLRSIRNVKTPVILSAIALVINVVLSWILIFGKLGAPKLGINGAAIAVVVARIVEFLILMIYMIFKEDKLNLKFKELLKIDWSISEKYFRNTIPVIMNEVFWSIGASILAIIVGRMGTEYVAANSMIGNISQIISVFGQGAAGAAAVMIGNSIGSGDKDDINSLKKMIQIIGPVIGIFSSLVLVMTKPFIPMLFNVEPQTIIYANEVLWAQVLIMAFKTSQSINMMGILRGGGDAKFVLINDVVFLWTLAVPLSFLAAFVWHLPFFVIVLFLNIEQFIKFFTSTIRLKNDNWIKNVTA